MGEPWSVCVEVVKLRTSSCWKLCRSRMLTARVCTGRLRGWSDTAAEAASTQRQALHFELELADRAWTRTLVAARSRS